MSRGACKSTYRNKEKKMKEKKTYGKLATKLPSLKKNPHVIELMK